MSNTNIGNVYAVAPELESFYANKAQIVRVNILNYFDDTLYQVIINSSTFSYTSPASGGDKLAVAAALVALINAGSEPVTANNNGNGTFNLRADVAGVTFNLVVDGNMSDITIQANKTYTATINLILSDVARDVKQSIFGNNQERAQRYLAAHYLTLARNDSDRNPEAGGFLTSTKVGDVTYNYSLSDLKDANRLDSTPYGRTYNQLCKAHVIPLAVVNPDGE